MKAQIALAAAIAQASSGYADAVFPAAGHRVNYAIHDTLPRGGAYDTTLSLSAGSAQSITVSAPGKGSMRIALDDGHPSRMDRSLGMGFHLVEVVNEVVQAGLAGRSSVSVNLGPPNAPPSTLHVSSSGGTITATGTATMPPPPMGGSEGSPPHGGPPQGEHRVNVRIVATVRNGKLTSAQGSLAPVGDARGPRHTWTVTRKP